MSIEHYAIQPSESLAHLHKFFWNLPVVVCLLIINTLINTNQQEVSRCCTTPVWYSKIFRMLLSYVKFLLINSSSENKQKLWHLNWLYSPLLNPNSTTILKITTVQLHTHTQTAKPHSLFSVPSTTVPSRYMRLGIIACLLPTLQL
jgi:hypothetical protein